MKLALWETLLAPATPHVPIGSTANALRQSTVPNTLAAEHAPYRAAIGAKEIPLINAFRRMGNA
jgi:hypothetical protein